jgi:hypothetical protein
MNVIPFKPKNSQIEAAVAAERRRCLDIIEEMAALAHAMTAHQALCQAHKLIVTASEGKSA